MDAEVIALQIDGQPLGAASMCSAVLQRSGDDWLIEILSDWSSDLCDRLRRSGAIEGASVLVSTADDDLSGTGRIEFVGKPGDGAVRVRIVGRGPLASGRARD